MSLSRSLQIKHYGYGELYEKSFENIRDLNINKNIKTVRRKEYLCMVIKQHWILCFQQEVDQGSTEEW